MLMAYLITKPGLIHIYTLSDFTQSVLEICEIRPPRPIMLSCPSHMTPPSNYLEQILATTLKPVNLSTTSNLLPIYYYHTTTTSTGTTTTNVTTTNRNIFTIPIFTTTASITMTGAIGRVTYRVCCVMCIAWN